MAQKNGGSYPWWLSWTTIIMLFIMGAWPFALALLFIRIFGEEKSFTKQKKTAVQETMEKMDAEKRAQERKKKASSRKNKKTSGSIKMLRLLGGVLLVIGAITIAEPIAGLIEGYTFYLEDLITSLSFAGAGALMLGRAQYLVSTARRCDRYRKAIGSSDALDLDVLARRVNRSPKEAAKELQKLIDRGLMGEDRYIDYERKLLLRFGHEPAPEPEPVPEEVDMGYSGVLRNLRRANDRIADEDLSRKIDRLEKISGQIFKAVEEDPAKRDRIRSFFDYYLPTTQKLLDAYADFDETGVEGEHMQEAKARIEATMDSIVEGFEHQLDQLYSADAMDVVSDVKVMETILNRDTASAAKDFGYTKDRKSQEEPQGQRVKLQ